MGDILVVDDEPKLGKIVAEMLELDGHHVQRVGRRQAGAHRPWATSRWTWW